MPVYYFHFTDGVRGYRDLRGAEHGSFLSALRDAEERAAELLDRLSRPEQRPGWRIVIADPYGKTVSTVWLSALKREGLTSAERDTPNFEAQA